MNALRVFWDVEAGWTVETPMALDARQAEAVVKWVKKVQGERLKSKRGDHREQAAQALATLTAATLKQTVTAKPNTEMVLFERK